MAGTAAGTPERYCGGDAHPAGGLLLVRGIPRRGRSPARSHDGVVEKAGAGVPEPGRYPENQIRLDEPNLSAGAAAHLRGQEPIPRRAGAGNTLCYAGACTEDAELRLRASGGRANDPGTGVGVGQRQGKEVLRVSAEGSQAEGRCHCRSDAEKERQRPPLSQQKEFRQIKNAVLQVAEQVRQNEITFEDAGAEQEAEQSTAYNVPYPANAWHTMAADETLPLEDRDEAAKQLEALADGGDRYAQYLTGILYRDGGLLIPDTEKAQHYLELAAQQDHAAAQYALGRLFLSDDPELQNPAQGFYWLERAAGSGNDYAAYRLGKEYLSGKNAPKNPERAAEYVRMAAEQGNSYAQYLLGKLCLSGNGVPQDKDAAHDWFQKAQAQGHEYAGFFMDRIERPEPPNVLLSATRLFYYMGKIFQSGAPAPQNGGVQIDRKRLAKLRRMRIAAGHRADDHEQEQTSSTMSVGW